MFHLITSFIFIIFINREFFLLVDREQGIMVAASIWHHSISEAAAGILEKILLVVW